MNEHDFRQFIVERSALNISALADELQIDRVNVHKIIAGLRNIPRAKRGIFTRIAQKYGYSRQITKQLPDKQGRRGKIVGDPSPNQKKNDTLPFKKNGVPGV